MAHKGKESKHVPQRIALALITAAVVYAAAAYYGVVQEHPDQVVVSTLIAMATAIVAATAYRAWRERKGEPIMDERTRLVNRLATGFSWWFTYVAIAVLLLAMQFKLATLSVESALSLVFFVMVASLIAARIYLSRKGDLE